MKRYIGGINGLLKRDIRHTVVGCATVSDVYMPYNRDMEHHRLRKYRGPETWARVKAAYITGESAPAVARRFDVGLANLRRRAMLEGWTRNRIAERLDRQLPRESNDAGSGLGALSGTQAMGTMEPKEALRLAAQHAAWLVCEGRAAEATALLKAADALRQLEGWLPSEMSTRR